MLAKLFAPTTPAEAERIERERVAARKPHLALVGKDRRPDPDLYRWWSVEELIAKERGQ